MAVLAVDAELAERLDGPRRAHAERLSTAEVLTRERGAWRAGEDADDGHDGLGLLVLDGVLVRRVGLEGRFCAELLSSGDLLQPAQHDGANVSLPFAATWQVLSDLRLAVLDLEWMTRMSPFPEVLAELGRRMLMRSRRLAESLVIAQHHRLDERLWLFFWELADRFGRVGPDGVRLELDLRTRSSATWSARIARPSPRRSPGSSAKGGSGGAGAAGCSSARRPRWPS